MTRHWTLSLFTVSRWLHAALSRPGYHIAAILGEHILVATILKVCMFTRKLLKFVNFLLSSFLLEPQTIKASSEWCMTTWIRGGSRILEGGGGVWGVGDKLAVRSSQVCAPGGSEGMPPRNFWNFRCIFLQFGACFIQRLSNRDR